MQYNTLTSVLAENTRLLINLQHEIKLQATTLVAVSLQVHWNLSLVPAAPAVFCKSVSDKNFWPDFWIWQISAQVHCRLIIYSNNLVK